MSPASPASSTTALACTSPGTVRRAFSPAANANRETMITQIISTEEEYIRYPSLCLVESYLIR
jgi:hypothetical protein